MAQKVSSAQSQVEPTVAQPPVLPFMRVGEHDLAIPRRATDGSAGIDLSAAEDVTIRAGNAVTPIRLGFATAIPEGHVGLLFSRSGLGKAGVSLANGVGVIDADYRGELTGLFCKVTPKDLEVKVGERVAQLVIVPVLGMAVVEAKELPSSGRKGGFGSTGR